jgi:hypothetical protein
MKNFQFLLPVLAFIILGTTSAKAQSLAFTNNSNCTVDVTLEAADLTCTVACVTPVISIPPGETIVNLPNCNGGAPIRFYQINMNNPKGLVVVGRRCFPGNNGADFFDCEDQNRTLIMESATEAIIL